MSNPRKIAFLGLGVMGAPMAGHLAAAGHDVRVYNRTASRASEWVDAHGGKARATPSEAAAGCDIVISCVGNDDDLAEVLQGKNGALGAMHEGALLIDHTTTSPSMAREVAKECSARDLLFCDAPISGGQAGAENAQLAIMCGGSPDAFQAAQPVFDVYGKTVVHVGPAGSGQATKMANQICIAGVLAGLSEAVRFAEASELDLGKVYEAISGGAAQSWQMDNRWETMARRKFDFGFAIDWMRKDLGYTLYEARDRGLSLPVTALVDQFYAQVQAMGGSREDTSALIRHLPEGDNS